MVDKKHIEETVTFLKNKGFDYPDIGIILGTGLSGLTALIKNPIEIDYTQIPHFPISTVEYHAGKLYFGTINHRKVMIMQGRFHMYEGYSPFEITYPIRIMKDLGVSKLFITNVSGAINPNFNKGDLMCINDHINLQGVSPLAFSSVSDFGVRFVDMYEPYNFDLSKVIHSVADEESITLRQGVYVSVIGPHLETKAEYQYLSTINADAVGMSTVLEVIVANHLDLPVAAISILTDECDSKRLKPINIDEIMAIIKTSEPKLIRILNGVIAKL